MQNTDSTAVLQTAEKNGKFAFGWDSDMSARRAEGAPRLGDHQLGPYYNKAVKDAAGRHLEDRAHRLGRQGRRDRPGEDRRRRARGREEEGRRGQGRDESRHVRGLHRARSSTTPARSACRRTPRPTRTGRTRSTSTCRAWRARSRRRSSGRTGREPRFAFREQGAASGRVRGNCGLTLQPNPSAAGRSPVSPCPGSARPCRARRPSPASRRR